MARLDASPAIASGPYVFLIRVSSETIFCSASSQLATRSSPFSRISGDVNRSRERVNWWAKRPFRHVWPSLAGPSSAGEIETIRPWRACASSLQPTPQ